MNMKSLAAARAAAILGVAALAVGATANARAQEFQMLEVPALAPLAGPLAPRTIMFTDHRKDEIADPATGLIRFSDWERARPQQKQLLSLFPTFEEPTVSSTESPSKTRKRRLHVYIAEARFPLAKPAGSIDLAKTISLPMIEQLDSSIKHRLITAAEALPNKEPKSSNGNPARLWCEGGNLICIQSKYQLEGRLPLGITLVNKLRESHRQIYDFMEFQSELRLIPQGEVDPAVLAKATGINAPIAGAIEQNIFYVNQVMQFGKFLAVLQPDPDDAKRSIATVFISLAVEQRAVREEKGAGTRADPAQPGAGAGARREQLVQYRQFDQRRAAEICPQPRQGRRGDVR